LSAALVLVGCDGWTFFERAPEKPRDGKPLSLKVLGTRACSAARGDARTPTPPLLGVEVELTSWDPGGVPVNFFYAALKDGEGRLYRAISAGCEPFFGAAPLGTGERSRGFLTFPLPPGSADTERVMKLVYAPRLAGSSEATPDARVELPLSSL
jgi:hypothetical protein